ncbi:MAG TPA: DUF1800 family protein [Devosia sp.]|nr:DUF1800 family protein [Devosia sp.]
MARETPLSFIALQRFGLGARPGDLAAVAADPRGAVLAEIAPGAALIDDPTLPDTVAALGTIRAIQKARQAAKAGATPAPAMMAPDSMMDPSEPSAAAAPPPDPMKPGNPIAAEIAARLAQAAAAQIGFAERWAMFWANHFAVQAATNEVVRWTAGPFDREAIRPHVFGRFVDLLFAATRHPAMLLSLNNAGSIGPDSKAGLKRHLGLNENHARELMELHTIGVTSGYTQADVTSFADVLTGWTFGNNPDQPKTFGQFTFNANAHEPGPQTILGTVYAQPGVRQGEAVLAMLAAHPATATHVATELVRYFVADTPPPDLVAALAATFTTTGGDLAAVARALVGADAAWSAPMQKLRLPQEYLLAASRALAVAPRPPALIKDLDTLGQPLFDPPSPEGYHDDAATWLAPDAMTSRLDIAQTYAQLADADADPRRVADAVLGDAQSDATRDAIARAESPVQGLTLLLMSPEFQRR